MDSNPLGAGAMPFGDGAPVIIVIESMAAKRMAARLVPLVFLLSTIIGYLLVELWEAKS